MRQCLCSASKDSYSMQCILLPTAIAKLRPKLTVPLTLKQAQLNLKGQKPNTVEPYGMPPTLQATASRKLRGGDLAKDCGPDAALM